ncbi:MAG TPA: aldo/keto reductase, partial [Candidatus Dormibacteraeota bacterium]|nr:aldo/keto reductase [Candidatus Dormibacteraeota bacterium]
GLVIGLSVSGPRQADVIRRALQVRVDGVNPFGCVQATWNILEPSAGPALAEAHATGWGVIVKEALANGRLASKDRLAIAAALSNPWADVVLSGAVTQEQLISNVRAAEARLSADDHAILQSSAEPPDQYWAARSRLEWR